MAKSDFYNLFDDETALVMPGRSMVNITLSTYCLTKATADSIRPAELTEVSA